MWDSFEDFIEGVQMGLEAAQIRNKCENRWHEQDIDEMQADPDYKKNKELEKEGEEKVMKFIRSRLGFQTDR